MKLILLLLLSVLVSCTPLGGLSREGSTYNEYLSDRIECLKMSAAKNCMNAPVYYSCMNQKGWKRQEGGFTAPKGMGVPPCD